MISAHACPMNFICRQKINNRRSIQKIIIICIFFYLPSLRLSVFTKQWVNGSNKLQLLQYSDVTLVMNLFFERKFTYSLHLHFKLLPIRESKIIRQPLSMQSFNSVAGTRSISNFVKIIQCSYARYDIFFKWMGK